MENELEIVEANMSDLPEVKLLAEEIWPVTYQPILTPEQIRYMMELFYSVESLKDQFDKHRFLLALINKEPAGFASFSPASDDGVYKLHKIYVKTGIQGRGIGRALIGLIINKLKQAGGKALHLNVNRNNKARLFYEKMGFEVIGEEDIDIGHDYWMNDYVMRLTL